MSNGGEAGADPENRTRHRASREEPAPSRDDVSVAGDAWATPQSSDASLDDVLQMAAVAHRYYVEGRTRVEIAGEMGLSRFKVGRILDAALRTGVVTIDIHVPEALDVDLSLRLSTAYGLTRAVVVSVPDQQPHTIRAYLGRAAARLLEDLVGHDDVLGLSSGRTIDAVTTALRRIAPAEVVQLTGMSGDLNSNPVELVRRVSDGVGPVRLIYAPLSVPTAEAAQALRRDPLIAATIAAFSRVTVALLAAGSWDPPDSRFYDGVDADTRARMLHRGVHADVAGILLHRDGRLVGEFQDQVLGIDPRTLRDIPERVLVAGGISKVGCIRAALHAGTATTLVTDAAVARALLP